VLAESREETAREDNVPFIKLRKKLRRNKGTLSRNHELGLPLLNTFLRFIIVKCNP
jgi:hypothetical protein